MSRAALVRAKILDPGVNFHILRHTFASRLVMNGVDLLTVKELGRWRTLAMVQRYAHLAPEAFAADYARLGSILPGPAEIVPLKRSM